MKETKTNLELGIILTSLADRGVVKIIIDYNGSGDSGAVEYIGLITNHNALTYIDNYSIDNWKDIEHAIEEWVYENLEQKEDWYNNDGGQGSFAIQVPSGEYTNNHGINTMSTETFDYSGNLIADSKKE